MNNQSKRAGNGDSGHTHAGGEHPANPRDEAISTAEKSSLQAVARVIARMLVDDAKRRARSGPPESSTHG